MPKIDELRAQINSYPDWGVYDGVLSRADVCAVLDEFDRVTAERDELVRVLPEVCHGECSGDPGVGWPACVLWQCELNKWGQPERGHCKYAPPHNYIGEEAVAGPQEVQDESN